MTEFDERYKNAYLYRGTANGIAGCMCGVFFIYALIMATTPSGWWVEILVVAVVIMAIAFWFFLNKSNELFAQIEQDESDDSD